MIATTPRPILILLSDTTRDVIWRSHSSARRKPLPRSTPIPPTRDHVQLGLDLLVDLNHLAEMTVGNASRPKVTCLMNPASKP
jgi:hypothetical protein